MIGLYSPQKEATDPLVVEESGSFVMVLIYGILAAFFLTVENMANKHLSMSLGMDSKHGATVGAVYLLVEGTLGTIALIIMTIIAKTR